MDQRAGAGLHQVQARQGDRQVVENPAYLAAGATAVFQAIRLSADFRDMHAVSQQAQSQVRDLRGCSAGIFSGYAPNSR